MSPYLVPRFPTPQAVKRLKEIETDLRSGVVPAEIARVSLSEAIPNPTGGSVPTDETLDGWRRSLVAEVGDLPVTTAEERNAYGMAVGHAIASHVDPVPGDASHDGVWAFLSLAIVPDVVLKAWPLTPDGLPRDRWIGKQVGRDRNFLKTSWNRWRILGPVVESRGVMLGSDEMVGLLERSSMARNVRLTRLAASAILDFRGSGSRMDFSRTLLKRLSYATGALNLDALSDDQLETFVDETVAMVVATMD